MTEPSAKGIAAWMVEELAKKRFLYQEQVAWDLRRKYGKQFTYDNQNGNVAIARSVLDEFRKLTADDVIWDRSERCWRHRAKYDKPGRQQD